MQPVVNDQALDDFENPQALEVEHEELDTKEQILDDVKNLADREMDSISVIESLTEEEKMTNENTESDQENIDIENHNNLKDQIDVQSGNIFPLGHEGLIKVDPLEQQLINEFDERKLSLSPKKQASKSENISDQRSPTNSPKGKQYETNGEPPNISDFKKDYKQ